MHNRKRSRWLLAAVLLTGLLGIVILAPGVKARRNQQPTGAEILGLIGHATTWDIAMSPHYLAGQVQITTATPTLSQTQITGFNIITDAYEQPNSGVNNDVTPGNFVGSFGLGAGAACVTPQLIVQNATLAKGAPGLQDSDWYNFGVVANAGYMLTVAPPQPQPMPAPIKFNIQFFDPNNNEVAFIPPDVWGATIAFSAITTGTYRIHVSAQNYPNYTMEEIYQITLCSFANPVTPVPTLSPRAFLPVQLSPVTLPPNR